MVKDPNRRLSGLRRRSKARSAFSRAKPRRKRKMRSVLPGASALHYGASMAGPVDMIDRPVPDLALPSSQGGLFRLRGRVGVGPLVLFFYIRNATPG